MNRHPTLFGEVIWNHSWCRLTRLRMTIGQDQTIDPDHPQVIDQRSTNLGDAPAASSWRLPGRSWWPTATYWWTAPTCWWPVLVPGATGSDVQGTRYGDGRREEEKPGCYDPHAVKERREGKERSGSGVLAWTSERFRAKPCSRGKKTGCGTKFWFWQVNYGKLLEMSSFFSPHIILKVAKQQDTRNKKCQNVGVALNICNT
jgi:hypothetical protein